MTTRAWFILAAVASARLVFGYQNQTIASLAPQLIASYGLDYTKLGTLIGIFVAPGILLALPLGLLGRRVGEGLVIGAGLALMAVGPVASALATSPSGIGAGRMLGGAGAVAMIVLQNKVISDWFTGRWFMVAISLSIAAFPVGVSAGQLVVPLLAAHGGISVALLSGGALALAPLALFVASYRPAPLAATVPRRFSMPSRRECALVMIGGLVWTAYTGSWSGFVSYVPALLHWQGRSAAITAIVMAIVTLGSVPPTLVGGPLAARIGPFPPMLTGSLALLAGCFAIVLTPWPIAAALIFGVLGSFHAPVIMAAGTLSARPEHRAVGMGLFYTTYYAGNALAPALCGRAADFTANPTGALYAAGLIGLLAFPLWRLHAFVAARGRIRP